MERSESAAQAFRKGFNCAQSVLMAFAAEGGFDSGVAAGLASPFGAGMGRRQLTCGAATGALMALGLLAGSRGADDAEGRERAYALTRDFLARFEASRGSLSCAELLGCDLMSAEGKEAFASRGLRESVCVPCVREAVDILSALL